MHTETSSAMGSARRCAQYSVSLNTAQRQLVHDQPSLRRWSLDEQDAFRGDIFDLSSLAAACTAQ